MASGGGIEIERLQAVVGVDLSELRAGLASARTETSAATAGMAGSFAKASDQIDAAGKRVVQTSGTMRQGMRQLSYQIGDVSTSLSSGISPMMVFAQQGDQVRLALVDMYGESSKFAAFMGGPWGAAIFAGLTMVGMLASSLYNAADAKKEAASAADALKEAEDRLTNATAAANHQTRQGILDDIARANSLRQREIQTRRTLQAELELARGRAAASGEGRSFAEMARMGPGAAAARRTELGNIAELEGSIKEQDRKIAEASVAIRAGQRQIAERDVAAATDAGVANNQRLEDASDRLARQYDSGAITLEQYKSSLLRETRAHDAQEAAIAAAGRAGADQRRADAAARREQRQAIAEESRAYREAAQFRRAENAATAGLISAQIGAATTLHQRAQLERDQLLARQAAEAEEIALNRDYTDAQKGRLLAIHEEKSALEERRLALDAMRRADDAVARDAETQADIAETRRETELDLLSQQGRLARTARDRQAISIRIVQLEHELAIQRQREIIASANRTLASDASTEAERVAAQQAIHRANAQIEGINDTLPGRVEEARRADLDPLDPAQAAEILGDNLELGIIQALRGKNLKDALRGGLFDLLNDAMTDAFGGLSKVAFGEQGLGGFLSGVIGSLFGGQSRAVGGPVLAGAAYNVGSGEKFVPGANGRVLSREDAMAAAGGGSGRLGTLVVRVEGARGNAEIMEMVRAGVQQGIGEYDAVVGERVDTNFKRRG